MSTEEKIQALVEKIAEAELGGGEKRIEIQHNKGEFLISTFRERLLIGKQSPDREP